MKKIAIVHFSPVERYPPAVNWLNFLGAQEPGQWDVRVFTTRPDVRVNRYFTSPAKFVRLERLAMVNKEQKSFLRYWNYLLFYTRTLVNMIFWRPDIVLYYESLSALPALLYVKYFNRRAELFVHYHEYTSEREYNEGIPMNKWPHKLERRSYPKFRWISHTNEDRMRMFLEENGNVRQEQTFILPNYPPRSWKGDKPDAGGGVLKFVHVGAVDLTTMYTVEFAEWINGLDGIAQWDIYSSNITTEAKEYLASLGSGHIRFMGSVEYDALPGILRGYDIGVIIYKGVTLNHRFSVPNKLFEYLACDLDIWLSGELDSSLPLATIGTYPKVTVLDYKKLDRVSLQEATDRNGLRYAGSAYYAEEVLQQLLTEMDRQYNYQPSERSR